MSGNLQLGNQNITNTNEVALNVISKNGAQNVASLDGCVSLGKSSVTKKEL